MAKNSERSKFIVTENRMFRGKMLEAGSFLNPEQVACSEVEVNEWVKKGWVKTAADFAKAIQPPEFKSAADDKTPA